MKSSIQQDFEKYAERLSETGHRTYKTDVIKSLIAKLKNDEDQEIESDLEELVGQLADPPRERAEQRAFKRSLDAIQDKVKKVFGYAEKGSLKAKYIGIGITFGLVFGAAIFNQTGPNDPGSGAGAGMVIGIVIAIIAGASEEKKAEKKGLLY